MKAQLREGGVDFGAGYDPMTAAHGMDGPIFHELRVDVSRDLVIKKDRHSAFSAGGRQQGRTAAEGPAPAGGTAVSPGGLEGKLRAAGVDTVLITGCVTNCCCEITARDAMRARSFHPHRFQHFTALAPSRKDRKDLSNGQPWPHLRHGCPPGSSGGHLNTFCAAAGSGVQSGTSAR